MNREDEAKQLIIDFGIALTSESGKRVLKALRNRAKSEVVVTPLDAMGRVDIYQVMLNNGQRSLITYIDSMLAKDPNKVKQEKAKG